MGSAVVARPGVGLGLLKPRQQFLRVSLEVGAARLEIDPDANQFEEVELVLGPGRLHLQKHQHFDWANLERCRGRRRELFAKKSSDGCADRWSTTTPST